MLCGVASRMDDKFDVEVVRLEIEITPRWTRLLRVARTSSGIDFSLKYHLTA